MEDRFSNTANCNFETIKTMLSEQYIPTAHDIDLNEDFFAFDYSSYPQEEYMSFHPDEEHLFIEDDIEQKNEKETRKNLIIWDWDDTLFPTHAFRTGQHEKDKAFWNKLEILMSSVEQVFSEMIKFYGAQNIIIVTNGSPTWIQTCLNLDISKDILMGFGKLLSENKIETISCSTPEIRHKHPTDYTKWKEIVFSDYFNRFFDDSDEDMMNCITSIGDSLCEYQASHTASKHLKNRILNRVRLKSKPSIDDMIFQLKEILAMHDQFGITVDDIEMDNSFLSSVISSSSETSTSCSAEIEQSM